MMPNQDGSGYGQFGAPRRQGPTIASKQGRDRDRRALDRHRPSPDRPYLGPVLHRRREAHSGRRAHHSQLRAADPHPQARTSRSTMHLTLVSERTRRRPVGQRRRGSSGPRSQGADPARRRPPRQLGPRHRRDRRRHRASRSPPRPRSDIMDAGRPLRTIRVVWFGAEEPGARPGAAPCRGAPADRYAIAGESDFGADRVLALQRRS